MKRSLPIVLSIACLLAGCGRKAPPKVDSLAEEARLKQEQNQARLAGLIRKGKAQLDDRQFDGAVATLTEARNLDPDSTEAREQLRKAKQGLHQLRLEQGKKALAEQRFDDAIQSLNQALELAQLLEIEDAIIRDNLQKAKAGRAERIEKAYRAAMDTGLAAFSKKDYQEAKKAYSEALRLKPDDNSAKDGLRAAQTHLDEIVAEAKKKQDFERAMTLAREAMKNKKHAEAVKYYEDALKILPTNSDAVDGRKVALKKRHEDYELVMGAGVAALKKEDYQGALNSFNEALRLIPDDEDAKLGKRKAEEALNKIAGEIKKKQAFDQFMVKARAAMKEYKHAEAVTFYDEALKLFPTDADALKGQAIALKRRQEDYQVAMGAGQKGLKERNYEGAVKSFREALRLMPEDKDAKAGLKTAQDALDALAAAKKKKLDFDGLVAQARAATAAKKHAAAVKLYEEALKLFPEDALALKERNLAKKAAADAAVLEAEAQKREKDYAAAILAGNTALTAKRYDDAKKAFTAALAIKPSDKAAQAGLNAIVADVKKKQDFDRLMNQAREALAAKKDVEAVNLYQAALNLFPNDPDAKKGHAAAKKAEEASRKYRKENYDLAMGAARDAITKQNYQGAVFSFKEALRIMPGDKPAQDGLAAAQAALFNQWMAAGRKAAQAKKFPDAVKAYTEALKVKPNDPEATAALNRARMGKP